MIYIHELEGHIIEAKDTAVPNNMVSVTRIKVDLQKYTLKAIERIVYAGGGIHICGIFLLDDQVVV